MARDQVQPVFVSLPLSTEGIEIIKQARKRMGLTQAKLAEAVGCHQQHIAKIEVGAVRWPRIITKVLAVLELNHNAGSMTAVSPAPVNASKRDLREVTLAYVREHGQRHGLLDALLPPDEQDVVVAAAMRLIEAIDGGQ